jgi:hypothetical protein
MSSSYICPNCGIKVSISEEAGCPGCGHIYSEPKDVGSNNLRSLNLTTAEIGKRKNPFGSQGEEEIDWVREFLSENIDGRDEEFQANPKKLLLENEAKCLAVIDQAPNAESRNILSSYLSWVNTELGRFQIALDYGVQGALSKQTFFRNQAIGSVLTALVEQNRLEDFEMWAEKARASGYPELERHEMDYFIRRGMMKEALEKCDEYYSDGVGWDIFYRADILKTFGRQEESEALYQKLASRKITDPVFASATNSLAFSILMPQKRFIEAEEVLMRAISTSIVREKINAYSNLAMVAYHLKEYKAAMRFATVGLTSHLVAIASESRLTICKIENQKLRENPNSTESEWDAFFDLVLKNIQITDFDDAADFFEYLIGSCERSTRRNNFVQIIEEQYEILRAHPDWNYKKELSSRIERLKVDKFSEIYLVEKRYPELEDLFTQSIDYLKNHRISALTEYLKIPFAGVEFRRKCLAIKDIVFLEEWAGFEENPEILLKLSENKVEDILISLAANGASTDEILMIIASEDDVDLDFAISTREKLSAEMIALLMKSRFESVRREIARRPDLDDSSYSKLATDVAALVRDAIRQNPACSQEIKALAALGSL